MNDEHLLDLRNKILEQQYMVDMLLRLLSGISELPSMKSREHHRITPHQPTSPSSYADVRAAFEQRRATHVTHHDMRHLLTSNEKEPASSLFLKLSQLMLKWAECELAVIKELRRESTDSHPLDASTPLNTEEWEILKDYFSDIAL
jgi:hypothetical protein